MLQALIGPVAELASTWVSGKVEEKKAASATKVAKAQAEAVVMQKKATGEIDWDLTMAEASTTSWKDEWLTLLFSIPLILAFCGDWGRQIVFDGFEALEQMPDWYQYGLGLIISATFAMRGAAKFIGGRK